MTRDEAARRLAGLMPGWRYHQSPYCFYASGEFILGEEQIDIPDAGAGLPAEMEFLGRIAEALGPGMVTSLSVNGGIYDKHDERNWQVRWCSCPRLDCGETGEARNLSHAVLLAAVAVLESRKGSTAEGGGDAVRKESK